MGKRGSVRSIQIEKGEVEYDSDMPIGALRQLFGAAQSGDLGELIGGLSAFVVSWPFTGKPSDPNSWDKLRRSEFADITQAILKDLGDLGEE
jgi:hypothetical protein